MTAPLGAAVQSLVTTLLAANTTEAADAYAVATVTAVVAGGAKDGNALVTVKWRGQTSKAAYLSSYTPVVNHVVLCARPADQLVIVGRLIGTP